MAMGGYTKRLFIQIGLDIGRAIHPLNMLRNGFNLLRSTLVATFRTTAIGGFFAALRAGFQVIEGVQRTFTNLVSQMADLQLATIRTAAVMSEGGSGFSDAFQQAADSARELSTQTQFTAAQVQEGLFTAAQAGYDLNNAMKFTQASLMLAATSGEQFQTVMNDMIGITRAFGISMNSVPQMADAIAGAAQKSKVSVQGLFEGLRNVASVANVAFGETKDTFVDMTAALMTLNDAGIENSQAGTKMRAALQQLNSGTSKTMNVFAKYGINLYKADAANQTFVDTLMKGQKASAAYEEELNNLKKRQFELAIAGQTGSKEYADIEDKVGAVRKALSELDSGIADVEQQFKLAGGQLKPFHEVLTELSKAPKEAIGRAFGIRGGEPILRLLQNAKNFEENRKEVQRFWDESEKGASILQNVYSKFLGSIAVKWQVMANEVMGIFSVIADAAFQAFGPLFEPIEMGLKALFEAVQANKNVFNEMFGNIAKTAFPVFFQIGLTISRIADQWKSIFTEGASVTLPVTRWDSKSKQMVQEDKTLGPGASVAEKFQLAVESALSMFRAGMAQIFETVIQPIVMTLGKTFGDAIALVLEAKTQLFLTLGMLVGAGFVQAFQQLMPQLLNTLATAAPKLAQMMGIYKGGAAETTLREKAGAMGVKVGNFLPEDAPSWDKRSAMPVNPDSIMGQFLANIFGGQDRKRSEVIGSMVQKGGVAGTAQALGLNMEEINKAGAASVATAGSMESAGNALIQSIQTVAEAAGKLNAKAKAIQQSQAVKDLKGI